MELLRQVTEGYAQLEEKLRATEEERARDKAVVEAARAYRAAFDTHAQAPDRSRERREAGYAMTHAHGALFAALDASKEGGK